jgi:hypothetical protein
MTRDWPADADAITAAREFLSGAAPPVVVASHNDVDGLAAMLIIDRALADAGVRIEPLPARRGEHVHKDAMRDRIRALGPRTLVVCDMGTRPGPILPGVPTLVIDHHDASQGTPEGALVVNGWDREPVASSSVLAWTVARPLMPDDRLAWIAALGAVADLGTAALSAVGSPKGEGGLRDLLGIEARGRDWTSAVSLLNAARRAPEDDAMAAYRVLAAARSPKEIAARQVPGADRLEAYRREVQAEVARCSRVPPAVMGDAALIRFASAAQVHPIVATRWSARLAPAVVIAANDGFLPGRVNFAVRNASGVDLLAWLRALPFTPRSDAEYANGHARATGGSLAAADFARFVEVLRARGAARRP